MEAFQIYHRFEEAIRPWPGEFPKELPYRGFACCLPCDSSSETPQVPPFLPRPQPSGDYTWGAYQDPTNLVLVMDATEGEANGDLKDREDAIDQLIIFQPEGLWYRTLQLGMDGIAQVFSIPYQHGPRTATCEENDWNWSVERIQLAAKTWRTIWRIGWADLTSHLREGKLKMSLCRTTIRTLEGVAWGAYGIWGPRFDECGTLRLEPESDLTPTLHDVTLQYDPEGAAAHVFLLWSNGYTKEESVPVRAGSGWHLADWSHFAVRINRIVLEQKFCPPAALGPFPIEAGWNEIHVASRGTTHARIFLEVSSDLALQAPNFRGDVEWSEIQTRAKDELGKLVRLARDFPPRYERWMGKMGSAVATWCQLSKPEPGMADWLMALGEFTLTLQRPDGTFSGCHLDPSGVSEIPWKGGAYDSGPIGEFWIRCHRATGDARFLAASERLIRAYSGYRIELNPNFAAFALFHLTAHWEETCDPLALREMEYYLRWSVTRNLLPLGFHGSHNYYTVYSSIVLRGMARCLKILPASNPWSPRLLRFVRRMSNQTLSRMQPNGSFDARDRDHVGETLWLESLFDVAMTLRGPDQKLAQQVAHFIISKAYDEKETGPWREDLFTCNAQNLFRTPSLIDYLTEIKSLKTT